MAIAFDNFNSTDNAAATSQPFSSAFTIAAGARAYLGIRTNQGSTSNLVTNVTDNKGGAWTFRSYTDTNGLGSGLTVWSCASCPGGSTLISITLSQSQAMRAVVASYTGASGEDTYQNNVITTTNQATAVTGNITTAGANRVLVGIVATGIATTTISPNSGETARGSVASGRMQIEDIAKAGAGTYTMSWAFSISGGNNGVSWAAIALLPSTPPSAQNVKRSRRIIVPSYTYR